MRSRKLFAGWAICLCCVVAGYGFIVYRRPLPALAATAVTTQTSMSNVSLAWPGFGEAAIGAADEGVLATHGNMQALPTASVAKILTALAVLKVHPLALGEQEPTLTLTQADADSYNAYVAKDGSVAKVAAGEHITEYQALEAMLLPSANNMADTLARWAFGSITAYSVQANQLALSLGMHHTQVGTVDASGYSPATTSTASDLVLLGEAALKQPVLAQIVAQRTARIPVAGIVPNVNWLLGSHGIKTGTTDQAGGVYLFSAEHAVDSTHSVTIVGAIMGAPSLADALNSAVPLLVSATKGFQVATLTRAGQMVGTYAIPWGGTIDIAATQTLTGVVWQGQSLSPHVAFTTLHAPTPNGTKVGIMTFAGTNARVPVAVTKAAPAAPWTWRMLHGL